MCHDSGVDIVVEHAFGLQRLHAADIELARSGRRAQNALRGGKLRLLFGRGRALRRLNKADLVGFDLHLQNARLERQRAVLDSCDLGLTARTGDLDQIADLNRARGLGDGLRALVAHARSVARLLDVVHDLGALGVHLLGIELFLLLAQRVELAERVVRDGLGLSQKALGLGFAATSRVLLRALHLRAEFARLARVLLALGVKAVDLGFFFL